jgi:Phosphotransferase enzyme family
MTRSPQNRARDVLRHWIGDAEPILVGEGMEGAVYDLGDQRVAKVWFSQSPAVLRKIQSFYAGLAAKPLSFAVPQIHEVGDADGQAVTIEKRLDGVSLSQAVQDGRLDLPTARARFLDVIAELGSSGTLAEARELSVLDEGSSLYEAAEDFPQAIANLAARRYQRFGPVLGNAVSDLDRKFAALDARLSEVDSGRRSVIHGDLIPANILVDASGSPRAVLDWGFLTTEGDPVFDAAIAASIFNMYGDDALETELSLYELIQARLGYDRIAMLVYRAAYCLITANAYSSDGNDGHFTWCAKALDRPDVAQALLG